MSQRFCALRDSEVPAGEVSRLSRMALASGLESLAPEDRFAFFHGVAKLPAGGLAALDGWPDDTIRGLRQLERTKMATFPRVAGVFLDTLRQGGRIHTLPREPLHDAPVVIFASNIGSQVPVSGDTLGNYMRGRRGLQPRLGQCYVASYLSLLGIETHVYNFALGSDEYEEFRRTLDSQYDRLWFVSFSSNFLGQDEIDTIFHVQDEMTSRGLAPRLVGGGMAYYFSRDVFLQSTPLEVVVGRYGEPSFAEMFFSSDYQGPTDRRENLDLFGHISNLHIRLDSEGTRLVHSTPERPLSRSDRQILACGFDVRKMKLPKYWTAGVAMGMCASDDLNIPLDFARQPGQETVPSSPPSKDGHSELAPLSLANYVFKPRTVKLMTTFGNCPRGCQFCQYTQFDQFIFFMDAGDSVDLFNQVVSAHPEVEMFVIDDDDFLLRKSHVRELIDRLRDNKATLGKSLYVETVPIEVEPGIMEDLRGVGFRAILLGIETPVERVAMRIGKFSGQNASFEKIVSSPYIAYDAGFFTRVTAIPFYPLIEERDLAEVISRLLEYINYGISVTVFPLVKALPGTEFVVEKRHEFLTSNYQHANGTDELSLLEWVLPDDKLVREIALPSMAGTSSRLSGILSRHAITGDYPMSLGVLAFFESLIVAWSEASHRTVSQGELRELQTRVEEAISKLAERHFVIRDVQGAVESAVAGEQTFEILLPSARDVAKARWVMQGLRMACDFGDEPEILGAGKVISYLAREGIADGMATSSFQYAINRIREPEHRRAIEPLLRELTLA